MTIKTALISVSDKTGVEALGRFLHAQGVKILSTGGTAKLLAEKGIPVIEVSEHTGFPEMLDGRVKTLHPKIHGGLLGRRDVASHQQAMQAHDIAPIDLVVVTLYPFEETVARGASFGECIENIDIGGPAMIRSAAKNHDAVTVIVDPRDYEALQREMAEQGATGPDFRRRMAAKAYGRTAAYDAAVSTWFAMQAGEMPEYFALAGRRKQALRYGENPHQNAAFYAQFETSGTLAGARQVQGKELSYNNINDTSAALDMVREFADPAVTIIKHANPCGVALAENCAEAYRRAFACDSESAFGGIIALNRALDQETAEAIAGQFAEVVIAPDAAPEALDILAAKKNLRVLLCGDAAAQSPLWQVTSVSGGFLLQEQNSALFDEAALKVVSKRQPTPQEMRDMRFAFTIAKHVKSNAVVLAGGGQSIGIGPGQTSRVGSVRIATEKAKAAGFDTKGCAMASEAFLPFDDNVHLAAQFGITSIIQPGGSVRDGDVIAAADAHNIALVMTGIRHFRH